MYQKERQIAIISTTTATSLATLKKTKTLNNPREKSQGEETYGEIIVEDKVIQK